MGRPQLIMYLSFAWFLATLVCLIIQGSYFGSAELTTLNYLTGYQTVQVAGAWAVPKLALGFFTNGLPRLILWDYSFLQGGYAIIRWFFVATLSVAIIWLITSVVLGVIQGIFVRR